MRGRKPAPNALKKLRGSRYVNEHEPPVDDGKPACPSYLSDEAKTVWRYHAANLHAADLLKKTDRDTFAGYCEAVADFRRATEQLQREGVRMVYQTHNGNWVENPYVHQKNRAEHAQVRRRVRHVAVGAHTVQARAEAGGPARRLLCELGDGKPRV